MSQMLCEICQKSDASVHIRELRTPDRRDQTQELVEYHFCEKCFALEKGSNPILNPLLKLGPSGRALKMRVASVSTEAVEVRLINEKRDQGEEQLVFSKSAIPEAYAEEGMEFEMFVTPEELKRMQK